MSVVEQTTPLARTLWCPSPLAAAPGAGGVGRAGATTDACRGRNAREGALSSPPAPGHLIL